MGEGEGEGLGSEDERKGSEILTLGLAAPEVQNNLQSISVLASPPPPPPDPRRST